MRANRTSLDEFALLAASLLLTSPAPALGQVVVGRDAGAPLSAGSEPEKGEVGADEGASLVAEFDGGNFVFLDEPGDGAIWARGPSYKASFSAMGFTYIPFLGTEAPRNFPVRFTPSFVGFGEANLLAGGAPVPERVGENRVVYDHGAFQEIYEVRLEGVEQLFVLPSRAGEGDLLVRMQVETDLDFVGVEEGKHLFEMPGLGGVRYGEAIALDAGAAVRPATVGYEGGFLEVRVPSSSVAGASYPLTIDPVISTFSIAPGNFVQFNPDVSFDPGTGLTSARYVYTWEHAFSASDHDIWSRVRTIWGTLGAYVAQDVTTADWRKPANADNNLHDRVLVVAEVYGFLGTRYIRGRTFSPITNANVSAQFDIEPNYLSLDSHSPDVGGDPRSWTGSLFSVVWQADSVFPVFFNDIRFKTVHATALQLGTTYDTTSINNKNPSISKGCGLVDPHWYVAWEYAIASDVHINGAVLSPDGTVDAFLDQITPFGGSYERNPDVASTGSAALVVYEVAGNIGGAYLTGSAASPSTVSTDLTLGEPDSDPAEVQRNPTVGVDDCRFAYAYAESYNNSATDYDIRLAAVRPTSSGFAWDQGHVYVANAFTTALEDHPKIVSRWTGGGSGPEYAVVFDDNNTPGTAWYEIHAALYEAHSGALTTATVPTSCGAPPPTIAASGTSALNGTLSVQATAGQGGSLLLLIGPPGATPLCAGTGSCAIGTSLFPPIVLAGGSITGTNPCLSSLVGGAIAFQAAEFGVGLAGGCVLPGLGVLLSDTVNVTLGY
ncbi:MAG: hypothetical protein L0323_20760 [Planctomycetes bacterium]|nr:hypothetical protein [Planctomycetota bacterium]